VNARDGVEKEWAIFAAGGLLFESKTGPPENPRDRYSDANHLRTVRKFAAGDPGGVDYGPRSHAAVGRKSLNLMLKTRGGFHASFGRGDPLHPVLNRKKWRGRHFCSQGPLGGIGGVLASAHVPCLRGLGLFLGFDLIE